MTDDEKFELLNEELDEQAHLIADRVAANTPERDTILRLSKLVRFGHKIADLKVRKDGKWYDFQADWLCRLFRKEFHSEEVIVENYCGEEPSNAASQ